VNITSLDSWLTKPKGNSMTRKQYLSKLTDELHYDEERMRVVVELLSAAPDMSENDFDEAWTNSKLAWRLWRTLMEDFELSPDSMAKDLTLHQLTVCYRLFQNMLTMFDTVLRAAVARHPLPQTTDQWQTH
jgi:hypothetical protein